MSIIVFFKKYGATCLVIIAILYLSLNESPVDAPPFTFPYIDKVVHFCMYSGLLFVFGVDICRLALSAGPTYRLFGMAWWIAVILGGTMELAQAAFTESRTADWFDFLANVIGASVGYGFVRYLLRPFWMAKVGKK